MTLWRMLTLGNVASDDSLRETVGLSGIAPRSLQEAFASAPSFVQDRWHARLYFLGMKLRLALAVLWTGSGMVGFFTPMAETRALFTGAGLPIGLATPMVTAASALDLILGILVLLAWRPMVVAGLMIVLLVVYTLFVGIAFPAAWIEPFGGLLKNIPLIPAVWVMGILSNRR